MAAQARPGDSNQELLRAARARLERMARAYATAHGYQLPRSSPG